MAEEPIKHNELIESDIFKDAKVSADELLIKTNALIVSFKQLISLTGKKIPLSDPKTITEAEQLATALKKITELENGLTVAQQAHIKAQTIANKQRAEYKAQLKDLLLLESKELGTLDRLKAVNSQLTRERGKLNLATEQGVKRLKEINAELDKNNDFIKENNDQLGKQKINIGNYPAQLKALQKELQGLEPGTKKFNDLAQKAGALKDKINDAKDATKAFANESKTGQAKTLFGQIGGDLANLDFKGAAEKASLFAGVMKSITGAEILDGLKNLGKAFLDIGKALLINPIFLAASAFVALGAAVKETYSSFQSATNYADEFNKSLSEQDQLLKDLKKSTRDLANENDLLSGKITEQQKKRIDEENKFKDQFIAIREKERQELRALNEKAAKETESTNTESALGAIGGVIQAKRVQIILEERNAVAKKINAKYRAEELALTKEFQERLKNVELTAKETLKGKKEVAEKTKKIIEQYKSDIESFYDELDTLEANNNSNQLDKNLELENIRYEKAKRQLKEQYKDQKDLNLLLEALEKEHLKNIENIQKTDQEKKDAQKEKERKEEEAKAKESQKRRKDELADELKFVNKITEGIRQGLEKRAEIQQQSDQRDIDMRERMLDVQTRLAAAGQENVLGDTLAQQAKAEEKKIQDAKRAAKQQENLALIETFSSTLQAALKADKPFLQAFGEALAAEGLVEASFSKLFSGFYEGTEDTGISRNPLDNKGGRIAILHDNERVIPKRLNKDLDGISNDELVNNALAYQNADLQSTVYPKVSVDKAIINMQIDSITAKVQEGVERAFEKMPTSQNNLDGLGEWTEKIQKNNINTIIHHKRNVSRPSLRLNG